MLSKKVFYVVKCDECGLEASEPQTKQYDAEKYVKLSDVLRLVTDSIYDLESNTDKDMFIEYINKLETKEIRIKEKIND